jgi:hypothetical protein
MTKNKVQINSKNKNQILTKYKFENIKKTSEMTTDNTLIREKILKGLELTYKRLIKHKIDRNLDLVISNNGKVVHIDPRKFQK